MEENPLVSVVIPTRNRPGLVCRAVVSARCQTYEALEIIVVIDGPDDDTRKAIHAISDERLRVILLEANVGASEARNTGVRAATGQWIAFLDDDDEWLPRKIEQQMKAALVSTYEFPVLACSLVLRTPAGDYVRPHEAPSTEQPVCEYLFCRDNFLHGPGLLQTSTLVARRQLLIELPIQRLKVHEDWDWLLRASQLPGFGIEFVREPLAIYYAEDIRSSLSQVKDWMFSLEWLHSNRALFTNRAFAGALLTLVMPQAETATFRERLSILIEAFQSGSPRLMDLVCFFRVWCVPNSVRLKLRALLTAVR